MKPLYFDPKKLQSLLEAGGDEVREASPEELRVLVCLLADGRADDAHIARLATHAGCGMARLKSALRYWQALGVLSEGAPQASATKPHSEDAAEKVTRPQPLPKGEELSAAEAAETIRDRSLATFIDTCQATVGRVFNTRELTTLTALLTDLPFTEEYLLTLIAYCKKKTRQFSFVYLEKTAYSMLQREILTLDDLNSYLSALDRFASEEWKLRRLLGLGDRRLSAREQEYFMRWTGEYGYGEEVIGIAYDITVDRLGKISLSYMNKLLMRFAEAGCKSESEVSTLLEKERAEHALRPTAPRTKKEKKEEKFATGATQEDPSATSGASFKRDDFFAAALRRSYGDDGQEASSKKDT